MDYSLTEEDFLSVAQKGEYDVIPIYCELLADFETPVSAYIKLTNGSCLKQDDTTPGFLLESIEGGLHQARYSFLGVNPNTAIVQADVDPLLAIEQRMQDKKIMPLPNLPDFLGGAMGYFAYDCVRFFEPSVKLSEKNIIGVPDSVFMFFDDLVVFDNLKHSMLVTALVHVPETSSTNTAVEPTSLPSLYTSAIARIQRTVSALCAPLPLSVLSPSVISPNAHTATYRENDEAADVSNTCHSAIGSMTAYPYENDVPRPNTTHTTIAGITYNHGLDGYKDMVHSLKEDICAGNIIQAVPSHRLSQDIRATGVCAFDIYRQLRTINPSPYMYYVNVPGKTKPSDSTAPAYTNEYNGFSAGTTTLAFHANESGASADNACVTITHADNTTTTASLSSLAFFQIVGASPEQLVKVDADRRVTTHPIAGTRRRGATPEEDKAREVELLSSEKERAEHIMLVDLGRNDIGRIAATGTVNVDSLMHIERYSHVMHIVSHVSGKLDSSLTAANALRAVFPAGTVSGAPKVSAMKLVGALERERRGIYAGCVGYFTYTGVMDTAIAIRTLVVKDGFVHLQAGGGIVYDSVDEEEYEETMNKMRGVEVAVKRAIQAKKLR